MVSEVSNNSIFKEWGLEVDKELIAIKGKQLEEVKLVDLKGSEHRWEAFERRVYKHLEPLQLLKEQWLVVYGEEEFNSANIAYEGMARAGKGFGINISDPDWLELSYDEAK